MNPTELFSHVVDHAYTGTIFSVGPVAFHFSQHLVMLWVACALAVVTVAAAARARLAGGGRLASAVEYTVVLVRDGVVFPAMGEKYGRKYLNFFLSITTLIFFCNFLGLIPAIHVGHFVAGGTATGNFWLNLGLASLTYVYGIWCCSREHGLMEYFHSFLPPGVPLFLAPLIWLIEFAGMLLKHAVLAIRLTANMMAGHLVLFSIIGLVGMIVGVSPWMLPLSLAPVAMAVAIYMLEILVALMQTAIFLILAAIFFGMAVNPHH